MISFVGHKEPVRVIRNAILDDKTPARKGTVIEYWRGGSDWEPSGVRKDVFEAVRSLSDAGRLVMCQAKVDGGYSYRAVVT